MTQPRRLSTTLALLKQDPNYIKVYEAAQVAMDNSVQVKRLGGGRYEFTNCLSMQLPVAPEGMRWEQGQDKSMVLVAGEGETYSPDEQTLRQVVDIRDAVRSGPYANAQRIYTSIGEEYDDEAEAIAQLNVGQRMGGTQVTLYTATDSSDYDMRLRIVPKNAQPQEHYDVQVRYPVVVDPETTEVRRDYSFVRESGNLEARTNKQVMASILSLVANIDRYGVRRQKDGKLFLPVGWSPPKLNISSDLWFRRRAATRPCIAPRCLAAQQTKNPAYEEKVGRARVCPPAPGPLDCQHPMPLPWHGVL